MYNINAEFNLKFGVLYNWKFNLCVMPFQNGDLTFNFLRIKIFFRIPCRQSLDKGFVWLDAHMEIKHKCVVFINEHFK